jgi:hypothetical protein
MGQSRRARRTLEQIAQAVEKLCAQCRVVKSLSLFGKSKRTVDGLNVYCYECLRKQWKERHKNNWKQESIRVMAWAKANPKKREKIQKRFRETDKGRLHMWSSAACQRAQQMQAKRGDGRIRKTIGGTVTAKQLRDLWYKQEGRCALTGREMMLRNGKQHLNSPSVDRKDRTRPYEIDNIRLVTYQANCARLFGSDEELFEFCQAILDHRRA